MARSLAAVEERALAVRVSLEMARHLVLVTKDLHQSLHGRRTWELCANSQCARTRLILRKTASELDADDLETLLTMRGV